MKKLFTIALFLLGGLAASAQGKWTTVETQADELKGEKGGTHYKYSVEGLGEIEIDSWDDWQFRVGTYDGSFYVEEVRTRRVLNPNTMTVKVEPLATPQYKNVILIGTYDNNDMLKDKLELAMEVDYSQNCQNLTINKKWFYAKTGKKIKKMFKVLQFGDGYIRIVAKRKEMPDFDIKITQYQE